MRYIWFVILLFSATSLFGQNSARVKELEKQRKAALAEIEMTNQLLKETRQTAQNSLNRLNLLSKQILSRKQVISLLNQEIGEIDKQIAASRREITALEKQLAGKRANYGKSVQSMYKRRSSQDKILYILSADNFAQSLRRMRYLREYANWQKLQATEIIDKQKEIAAKQQELEKTRNEKNQLLEVREDESRKLQSEEDSQKEEVRQLSKKQKDLQAALKNKQRQADALNRQIEKQIADEIARADAEAKASRAKRSTGGAKKADKTEPAEPIREERVAETKGGYAMTKEEKRLSDDFAGNRGRLPYPVSGRHTIVATFGEQQHQELKYVRTNNSGIDIQTSPGADARAVFNGEVTRVFVVPGYNNSVIIRHGNYLTVYSNLSQVYVKAGDKVSTRQAIGKIFTDTEDGNVTILHFQLWKEKTKLNPAPWLE
ncbi:murein hydrolase activator EnvC [Parabacteroides sp. AM08-6]|uniref:murein hydrolase activator EnvC family protein n=1 Tax=Parabacteroides sp. AM08-6 TaxID=2292053 RepID=UPI000EFF2DE8|nr:peptidoglycan DD-metalloendopeptidase family protein [Parabacteroides sp. AM08-6]RHJ80999.1 peptidase M24 [Parabacteroides sp. AM08-6]